MKKISIILIAFLISFGMFFFLTNDSKESSSIKKQREKHAELLLNHPFSKTAVLSKNERKSLGLPPDAYYEQRYLLEMNPKTGRAETEKLLAIQKELNENTTKDIPGGAMNAWEERGPRNVPGRTRAIMYDPNDATHKRVFAGGVSGGLWTWEDIENNSSLWQKVGIPENLAVSSITYDPNNSQNMFVGTGESYVGGLGNGIWRSIDGGVNWEHVFGGSTGTTYTNGDGTLTVNSPAGVAGEYMAIKATFGATETPTLTSDLVLVDDGSGNNEGCGTITNAAAINGHIAVIERGECEFGHKVLNAENAGAIAVLVINNVAGTPIPMGPGAQGGSVTIPSFMISVTDGVLILDAMASGTVNADFDLDTDIEPVGTLIPGAFHINDIRAWNNDGSTELFAAVSDSYSNGATMGPGTFGLYKSTDNGTTWNKLTLPQTAETGGNDIMPNDIEIGADNKIWIATTDSRSFENGGGRILKSTDGVNFELAYSVQGGAKRTEIAVSSTDPDKIYILAEHKGIPVIIFKSTDGFATNPTYKAPPSASDDGSVPNNDFTRGQFWYDLMIAVDPDNDEILYVGGVDAFRSANGGSSWARISKWSSYWISGSFPLVHADQHELVFHPTDSDKAIMATDGGVFYASSLSSATNSSTAIVERKWDYNTTQFYNAGIGQSTTNEKLLAGAQDNGTFYKSNASSGTQIMSEINGGDGMLCFVDKDEQYLVVSNPKNNFYRFSIGGSFQATLINDPASNPEGNFVNPAELDDNMEILYTNGTNATTLRITRVLNVSGSPSKSFLTDDLLLGEPSTFKVSPYTTSSSKLFVGTTRGNLFRIDNANSTPTWNKITGPEFFGSVSAINFGENEDEIMVTFYNYGTTNIWFTTNGGTTWQNKEGDFPDMPINDIMMNPLLDNEVILGTDLGVWYTANFNDASPNWLRAHNGMQNVKVTGFDLRTADNKVVAATYGRGLFTGYFNTHPASIENTNELATSINVYPTLVTNGSITIESTKYFGKTDLAIFDMQGKEVVNQKIELNKSKNKITFNLKSGIYILKIQSNGLSTSQKIIVE